MVGEYLVNKGQLTKIAILCGQQGINAEMKAGMVREFSEGRCSSSKELTWKEAKDMIAALERNLPTPMPKENTHKKLDDAKRKRILHMAHSMGWQIESENGTKRKIDMERVNEWCKKYGHLHLPLNKYKGADLSTLNATFERMYKQFLAAM